MPRCKNCKQKFDAWEFNGKFCKEPNCKDARIEFLSALALKNLAKQKREKNKQAKEKLKTKSDYEAELQVPINKIARLLDKGSNCMMCDNRMKRKNACHYHSRGSSPTLKFNLLNIWIGCHSCNSERGGNIIGYDNILIDVYGREKWEYIKFNIVREIDPLHLSIEDLKEAKKEANSIVLELTKLEKVYSISERWELRKEFNKRIGIYN
jgi:hypothetical protein